MTMQETRHETLLTAEPNLAVQSTAPKVGSIAVEKEVVCLSPHERAIGRIEHLLNAIEGKENKFSVYFVLDLEDHLKMHNHFLAELKLEPANPLELSKQADPTIVHVVTDRGEIDLIRTANCFNDGPAFDVSYKTIETTELAC